MTEYLYQARLEEIEARYDKAIEATHELYSGREGWPTIESKRPINRDKDADLIIYDSLTDIPVLLTELKLLRKTADI